MDTRAHLNSLESTGFIRVAATVPNLEYWFRHEFVQNAAYGSLVRADRRRLHQAAGEALEQANAARLDEVAALLARHFEESGALERAVRYLVRAGDRARRAYANAEALDFYRRALRYLEGPVGTIPAPGSREAASHVHEHMGDVLAPVGRAAEARAAYERALTGAAEDDRVRRASLHRKIGAAWDDEHQLEAACAAYDTAAAALGGAAPDSDADWWREWVRLRTGQMMMHYWRGEWREMAALAEATRPALERHGTPALRARFFDRLWGAYVQRDHYLFPDETMSVTHSMLSAAEESDDLFEIANARFSTGFGRLWRGELDEAEAQLQSALQLAERLGNVTYRIWSLAYLTVVRRKRGQVAEARQYAQRSLDAATMPQLEPWLGLTRANLAWIAWREGDLTEAEAQAQAALDLWRDLPVVMPFRWAVLWPLAGVALHQGRLAQAVDCARQMLDPDQQPQPNELTAALAQAVAAWERGQPDAARAHLERAAEAAGPLGYL